MDLPAGLKLLGLNHSEIRVYLYLLENGLSTPPRVSRGTGITRTNCYNILKELKNKDLIDDQANGKRLAYLASDPASLVRALDRKREAVQQILPDLHGLFTTQKNKPKIQFYDGSERIKEIYLSALSAQKVTALGSFGALDNLLPDFFTSYRSELKKRHIAWRHLLPKSATLPNQAEIKNILNELYDAHFLADKYSDLPISLLIWENNVALITATEPFFGTVLTNPLLAATFNIIFEVMWEATN